ncbi:hypothetical protein H5410_004394 [Solanum commersonii]|uniref:Uncharacterized protein n=1 Tax=Solanum commersonii TaxID=4109 RepID=A0A9J6B791_SOLCO|nr:hypothetical protein H5410_004394 [Solanum commersonii]
MLFENRKKHVVSLPYGYDFDENNIPTKARPCQMNSEYLELCNKEISSLLQKATLSSGTSGININHPMYKEFTDFMKSKKELDNNPPSYSSILMDDENIKVFDMNDKKEGILLLEEDDLKWRNEPWQIIARMHYEIILSSTGCEFQHFYPANTKKVYNFSKMVIKKIIAPEEWGMSTLKELDYIHPEQKIVVKYNY